VFLLPFVAIRLTSIDRQSGALALELQRPMRPFLRVLAKAVALLGGWLLTAIAGLIAVALWKSYGGHVAWPELGVVFLGQLLNAAFTIALGIAIASMTDHPSTAAIVALAITIGTWIVDFAGAIYGGVWSLIAAYTPASIVAQFAHGLVDASTVLIAIVAIIAVLGLGAVWMQTGVPRARRWFRSAATVWAAALIAAGCVFIPGGWDASENRQNSFDEADQEVLEHLAAPVQIDVHLAPQDPRRQQFERSALPKLRRTVPHLAVRFVARTSSGLYEQADPGYGEIVYTVAGRQGATRAVTDESAVETIFDLARITPPAEADAPYLGYPFIGRAGHAPLVFYGIWPALIGGVGVWLSRRNS